MKETVEMIDSSRMKILCEFSETADDGDITPYKIGVFDDKLIIASQSSIVRKPQGKVVPREVDDKTRAVFERGIARDWWSGDFIFGLENFDAVLVRLEEIYGLRRAQKIDLDKFEIERGKDQIAVRMNSVMPHNVGTPIVTLQLTNYRLVDLDGVKKSDWHFYIPAETGRLLMLEMQKIAPKIIAELQLNK